MIIGTKNFTFDGEAPYNWSITSSTPNAVPTPAFGTSNTDNLTITVEFANETVFNTAIFQLYVTDDCGAFSTFLNFQIDNPCPDFTIGDITSLGGLSYYVPVLGGDSPWTYTWSYDTTLFMPIGATDGSTLNLQGIFNTPPTSTIISVEVTDNNGCKRTKQYVQTFCQSSYTVPANPLYCVSLETNPTGTTGIITSQGGQGKINVTDCPSTITDWTTLLFSNVPSGMFLINNNNGTYKVYANNTVIAGTYTVYGRVKNSQGVWSDNFPMSITVPECTFGFAPQSGNSQYVFMDGEAVVSTLYEVEIDALANGDIDWGTFTFIAGTGQTLVSATSLTTGFAAVTLTPGRIVRYTPSSLPTLTPKMDIVMWRVADTEGNYTKRGRVYFDYNSATKPTAVADTMCAICGSTSTKNVLTNDTGDIDPRTLELTTATTKGSYIFSDSNFVFTALSETTGTDTPQYRVANYDGDYSSSVNITITIICAGEDNSSTNCTGETIDFTSFLSDFATAGCTWAQDAGNPDTVSLASPAAVDFTGKPTGTYLYTYTCTSGSCSTLMTLTINILTGSLNDNCTGAVTMSFPTINSVNSAILSCDTEFTLQTVATTIQNPATWNSSRSGDVWFKFTTTGVTGGFVTVNGTTYGETGIRNPQIALYGGGCTIDTFTTVSNSAKSDGSQSLTHIFSGLTATTQYFIRVSSGEYNGSAEGGIGQFVLTVGSA